MTPDLIEQTAAHGGSPSLALDDYWWYRVRAELLRLFFQSRPAGAGRVLDVGSADGPSVGWLTGSDLTVSVDLDPRGLRPGGVCASALALPFRDGSFDVVAAFDVIEHCDPEATAMAELARVLRPGGTMMLAVPAYQWAWSDHDVANGHHRRYTRRRLVAAMQDAGLEVQRASYAFAGVFPLFAAERLVRRMLGRGRGEGPADIASVPTVHPLLERVLRRLSRLDACALPTRDLPFGSSIFAVAVKPAGKP